MENFSNIIVKDSYWNILKPRIYTTDYSIADAHAVFLGKTDCILCRWVKIYKGSPELSHAFCHRAFCGSLNQISRQELPIIMGLKLSPNEIATKINKELPEKRNLWLVMQNPDTKQEQWMVSCIRMKELNRCILDKVKDNSFKPSKEEQKIVENWRQTNRFGTDKL